MAKKPRQRKSWREKFENPSADLPKIVNGPSAWQKTFGGRRVLVATPRLVDEQIRKVPKGKLVTVNQIRDRLAKEFKADSTCPLTTGIFLRIIAEVSEEEKASGKKKITPYWRVLRKDGSLNSKFPGGIASQASYLRKEGHSLFKSKGKKEQRVKDFEDRLVTL